MSIEGIVLEHFSVTTQIHHQNHAHIMLYFTTSFMMTEKNIMPQQLNTANRIIDLLNKSNIAPSKLSTQWENTYGYTNCYRCTRVLLLLSMLSQ